MNWKKALMVAPLSLAILVPTAATSGVANAASQPTVDTPAANLRGTLSTLLSEHANLAIITMRKGIEGAPDFQAAAAQLAANTDDLANAIGSVYGSDAAKTFKQMWSNHIGYFVEYVQGTAKSDAQKKQEALKQLSQYKEDFSKWLQKATGGRVESSALAQGLQEHVNQLVTAFNDYVKGDYQDAYNIQVQASSHMYMTAKGLSSAIANQFPDKFNNSAAVTPASDLRETLSQLLEEHVALAITAMQNGIEGKDSQKVFTANAAALADNTDQLAKAIGSVYGDAAAKKFKQMWSGHIGDFVEYVQGTAKNDKSMQQDAKQKLDQYSQDFSNFISQATGGKVPSATLQKGLQEHINQLLTAFNAYHNKDYKTAYNTFDEAYKHMGMTAKALSGAIVSQYPDKFQSNMPSGMPKTDLGGTAGDQGEMFAYILAALAILAAAGVFVYRRKATDAE